MNTLILARQRRHNCTWNNCSIWTDVEVFYMVWEKIVLEFITKYSLPKMFRILFWMEVGTTRVQVHCIMYASTKIEFNLKWLICLEHLLEFEPNLQPSSPNFKYSVTKYFLTLSIYIYKYQLIPVAKHVHYVNSGTGIYNYINFVTWVFPKPKAGD